MLLYLVRHAPAVTQGRLTGRRDVPADCSDEAALAEFRRHLPDRATVWASPAQRCRMTVNALQLAAPEFYADLWEQDFGAWEGLPYQQLPDLGSLSHAALANHRPPGGESFELMASRVRARLYQARGDTVIIAHGGTVRAALTMVVGPAALAFEIDPLSLTILRGSGPDWSAMTVNWTVRPALCSQAPNS
ncbi:MAG: histidine phosphatase family protein [Paracoccus sp. (in: a-proteobacteria)]